jgi:prepilin-type N-terminal cleavage/methylation domain-containing protein
MALSRHTGSGSPLYIGDRSRPVSRRGFSVVELLVVLLVIGITIFFAVPHSRVDGASAREQRERRVAQSIVTVYQSGFAAGVAWNGSTRNAKVDAVISGQAPSEGAFSGKFFKVPATAEKDMAGAFKYIGCDSNGDLFYDKSGEQPSA